jgi:tetratricopeptide (TPR) repeat protein
VIGLALLLAIMESAGSQDEAWARLWSDVEALNSAGLTEAEARGHRASIHEALERASETPQALLLRAAVEALDGRPNALLTLRLEALRPRPFSPRELWHLGRLLPPGPERAHVVIESLENTPTLERWQVLVAWNVALDEARALRVGEGALPIQLALHERYGGSATAYDLALTHRALGQGEAAERVLAAALAALQGDDGGRADLWEARGLNALGFGDEARARDYLGRALSNGSDGAGLVLSRLELMSGRPAPARAGFQALILDSPPPDWAWRGWGMTLLPLAEPAASKNHDSKLE